MFDVLEPIYCYCVTCPRCNAQIVLPRQSPLGRFDYPEHPSSDRAIADFLCLKCENGFSDPIVRLGQAPALSLRNSYLLEVPYRYGLGNSETRKALYIEGDPASVRVDALQRVRDFLKLSFGVVEIEDPIAHLW